MENKPAKLTPKAILVLLAMKDHNLIIVSSSVLSTHSQTFHKADDYFGRVMPEDVGLTYDGWNKIRGVSGVITALYRAGYVTEAKKPEKAAWYDHPYKLTQTGLEAAEEYRVQRDKILAKQKEKRISVEKLIIIRSSMTLTPDRQYAVLCRVVKETSDRYYIEKVKSFAADDERYSWYRSIQGSKGNIYVSKKDVSVDNATEEMFDALVVIENDLFDSNNSLRAQEENELAPILERYRQRAKQLKSEFEIRSNEAAGKIIFGENK